MDTAVDEDSFLRFCVKLSKDSPGLDRISATVIPFGFIFLTREHFGTMIILVFQMGLIILCMSYVPKAIVMKQIEFTSRHCKEDGQNLQWTMFENKFSKDVHSFYRNKGLSFVI